MVATTVEVTFSPYFSWSTLTKPKIYTKGFHSFPFNDITSTCHCFAIFKLWEQPKKDKQEKMIQN